MANNGTEIGIYEDDDGTTIRGTAKQRVNGSDSVIDLNDLDSITLTFRDPDGDTQTQTATAENVDGGTDGIWTYTTASAIFAGKPGQWKIQAKYTFTAGAILYSQIKTFNVIQVL